MNATSSGTAAWQQTDQSTWTLDAAASAGPRAAWRRELKEDVLPKALSSGGVLIVPAALVDAVRQYAPYIAEVSGQRIYIEIPQGDIKADISCDLRDSIKRANPGLHVSVDAIRRICQAPVIDRAADVGVLFHRPSRSQRTHPRQPGGPSHEDIWIEIVNNSDYRDKSRALEKIETELIPLHGANMDIFLISFPDSPTPIGNNPAPMAASVPAVPVPRCPPRAPWVAVWPRGTAFNNPFWYRVRWNEHIPIPGTAVRIECNVILNALT